MWGDFNKVGICPPSGVISTLEVAMWSKVEVTKQDQRRAREREREREREIVFNNVLKNIHPFQAKKHLRTY